MQIILRRAAEKDAEAIWRMQVEAFGEMYARYRDTDTSPAKEPPSKVLARLRQPFTYYYFIDCDGETVGAIRVVDHQDGAAPKRVSPLFVLARYRNRGIAQAAMAEAERIHGADNWELDTILQEAGNCRLYEKMGYHQTGAEPVNDRMTLAFYRKD